MDRRDFLKLSLDFALVALAEKFFSPVIAVAATKPAPSKEEFLRLLENVKYEKLSFLVYYLNFVKIAECYIHLKPHGKKFFVSEALGEAEGIADVFSGYKSQKFVSRMELVLEPSPRLLPVTFERTIVKRDGRTYSRHSFDYKKRLWNYKIFVNGKLKKQRSEEIPHGVIYENFASIPYNLRLGVYGAIEKGRKIEFKTIPYKGINEMSIEICDAKRESGEKWFKEIKGANFLVSMKVAEKILGTKPAEVMVAVSKNLTPLGGLVKDALPVGNIYVNLKAKEYIKPPVQTDRIKSIQRNTLPVPPEKK